METSGIPVELLVSNVRLEFLIEELIFQLIMARYPDKDKEFHNEKFKTALDNVQRQFDASFQAKKV